MRAPIISYYKNQILLDYKEDGEEFVPWQDTQFYWSNRFALNDTYRVWTLSIPHPTYTFEELKGDAVLKIPHETKVWVHDPDETLLFVTQETEKNVFFYPWAGHDEPDKFISSYWSVGKEQGFGDTLDEVVDFVLRSHYDL